MRNLFKPSKPIATGCLDILLTSDHHDFRHAERIEKAWIGKIPVPYVSNI